MAVVARCLARSRRCAVAAADQDSCVGRRRLTHRAEQSDSVAAQQGKNVERAFLSLAEWKECGTHCGNVAHCGGLSPFEPREQSSLQTVCAVEQHALRAVDRALQSERGCLFREPRWQFVDDVTQLTERIGSPLAHPRPRYECLECIRPGQRIWCRPVAPLQLGNLRLDQRT